MLGDARRRRMRRGAPTQVALFALASCLNTCLAGVEGHHAYLDIGLACAIAALAGALARTGAGRTLQVARIAMGLRWLASLVALLQAQPRVPVSAAPTLAISAQLVAAAIHGSAR